MAKWFRSEEMEYVSLIVNEDAAHGAVNDLGMLGIIQFTDVRTWGGKEGRPFLSPVKRRNGCMQCLAECT
jgi:V-type H+-transporting ATPase subunit a